MGPKKPTGICALTGNSGRYVKCHIIPKSLTPREIKGGQLLQSDGLSKPIKRFDSWYDPKLVIRKGEDFLADIDDRGFKELVKQKLIWRSWKTQNDLELNPMKAGAVVGIRSLYGVDHLALAKLAISVMWRAGTSTMKDMQKFRVAQPLLDAARQVILGNEEFDPNVFPIKVFQYVTKGDLYNMTPMNHSLPLPSGEKEPFFRISANGVFFHIVDSTNPKMTALGDAKWFLGNTEELAVLGLNYEDSAQFEMSSQILKDTMTLISR